MFMMKKTACYLNCGLSVAPDITKIIVHGAKEHNLKNICFEIPKSKFIALTGPSGSGKSTIASDILQKECIRQYLESLGMVTDHLEKAKVDSITGLSPSIGVTQRITDFNSRSTVGTKSGVLSILRNIFATIGQQPCIHCGKIVKQYLQDKSKLTIIDTAKEKSSSTGKTKKTYFDCLHCSGQLEKLKMNHFSLNTLEGACSTCKGIGEHISINLTYLLNEEKTIKTGAVALWNEDLSKYYESIIIAASKYYNFSFDSSIPIKDYTQAQRDFLLYGISFPSFAETHKHIQTPKKISAGAFEGIIPYLMRHHKKNLEKASNDTKKYMLHKQCNDCTGSGFSKSAKEVTVGEKNIIEVSRLNLQELLQWIQSLDDSLSNHESQVFATMGDAIKERISHLIEVGLEYVTLERTLPSLSAGEAQRVKLANLLGSGLTGVLYVLDEPTTGLHPHDNAKLLNTIRMIQKAGNTVLIIEHDPEIIKHADYILNIGPGGGSNGGNIIASGSPASIMQNNVRSTANQPTKNMSPISKHTNPEPKFLTIYGASEHNLQNLNVSIPIGQLVVLTGVSGSGKSTFLFDILDKAARQYLNNTDTIAGKHTTIEGLDCFNRIITVDQATIGKSKSTKSNVATYTKLFDLIRDLFASLQDAKIHNFNAESFSFNISNERCTNCNGAGILDIDMTFMPDVKIECAMCNGMRFNETLLSVKYNEHNISNVLDMTISDALELFKNERNICAILDLLVQVGLAYLKLGQSTSTLSGGEAQRIKLASELSKPQKGNTLYLLDEPTTGLHPQEVEKLLNILKKLVSKGNTVIVIEHNLDIMCNADTIIDFGPGSGPLGGKIVATGTPKEIAACKESLTGQALATYISSNLP